MDFYIVQREILYTSKGSYQMRKERYKPFHPFQQIIWNELISESWHWKLINSEFQFHISFQRWVGNLCKSRQTDTHRGIGGKLISSVCLIGTNGSELIKVTSRKIWRPQPAGILIKNTAILFIFLPLVAHTPRQSFAARDDGKCHDEPFALILTLNEITLVLIRPTFYFRKYII